MKCIKCNSENIQLQRVSTTKDKGKGLIYWLCFGWLLDLMLWVFLTLPRLIWAAIRPRRVKTKYHTEAICQSCGYSWRV